MKINKKFKVIHADSDFKIRDALRVQCAQKGINYKGFNNLEDINQYLGNNSHIDVLIVGDELKISNKTHSSMNRQSITNLLKSTKSNESNISNIFHYSNTVFKEGKNVNSYNKIQFKEVRSVRLTPPDKFVDVITGYAIKK